jgi:hypothetical protein
MGLRFSFMVGAGFFLAIRLGLSVKDIKCLHLEKPE